jgi:CheY-like chemotaxis protein
MPEVNSAMTSPTARHTVLIVEDEAVSRRALASLLQLSGYDTLAVPTAEEALEHFAGGHVPEVALIDLDLPGMNGLELIDLLRQQHPAVVPVLITATSRERIEHLSEGKRVEYMRKPIDLQYLLTLMQRGGRAS